MIMNEGLDWVHHDSKTFDEEQFMENIERKHIEKHSSYIEGFTKDYVDKLLKEKDKEIKRLNNIINELEKMFINDDRLIKEYNIEHPENTLDNYSKYYLDKLKELKESK